MTTPHVNKSTACGNCGHAFENHCDCPRPHIVNSNTQYESIICCIARHCTAGRWDAATKGPIWCDCLGFQNPYTGKVSPWRKAVEADTACARCGHRRDWHCYRGKSPRYACTHVQEWFAMETSEPMECTSTSCADTDCSCTSFLSPYRKKRATARKESNKMTLFTHEELQQSQDRYFQQQAARQPAKPRPKNPKVEILLEVARDYPDATVAELAEASGMSKSWVRKNLKTAGITPAKPCKPARGSEQVCQ